MLDAAIEDDVGDEADQDRDQDEYAALERRADSVLYDIAHDPLGRSTDSADRTLAVVLLRTAWPKRSEAALGLCDYARLSLSQAPPR